MSLLLWHKMVDVRCFILQVFWCIVLIFWVPCWHVKVCSALLHVFNATYYLRSTYMSSILQPLTEYAFLSVTVCTCAYTVVHNTVYNYIKIVLHVSLYIGWGSADFLGTRLLPLWFGARGSEFDWIYLQNSLDCNINLVRMLSVIIFLYWYQELISHWRQQRSIKLALPAS